MTKAHNIIEKLLNKPQWFEQENKIWLFSTITLRRNLRHFKFPSKLSEEEKEKIFVILFDALSEKLGPDINVARGSELSPLDKEFLYEHFLMERSLQQYHHNEGFTTNLKGDLIAFINVEDHLQIRKTTNQVSLEQDSEIISQLDQSLNIPFAFNKRFGYLNSSPRNAGVGLHVCSYLDMSATILCNQLETIKNDYLDRHTKYGNIYNSSQPLGNIICIANSTSLGLSEEQILSKCRSVTTKFHIYEKSLRDQLREKPRNSIVNTVHRALGLLKHSIELDLSEGINAISLIKLGIDLGWIKGGSIHELNEHYFDLQRSHILTSLPNIKPDETDLPAIRANQMKQALANLEPA